MDFKHDDILSYSEDTYNGAIIDAHALPDEIDLFVTKLENSLIVIYYWAPLLLVIDFK